MWAISFPKPAFREISFPLSSVIAWESKFFQVEITSEGLSRAS